jgi:ElaB/YqjD/DUF883 family membrane-anchored ribosome-binding protein
MTNEELFDDLKQFITATVSQQTAHLDTRIDGVEQRLTDVEARMATKDDLARVEERLNGKLDQVQDAIADTVTQVAEAADVAVQNHEQHYHGHLKHRAA